MHSLCADDGRSVWSRAAWWQRVSRLNGWSEGSTSSFGPLLHTVPCMASSIVWQSTLSMCIVVLCAYGHVVKLKTAFIFLLLFSYLEPVSQARLSPYKVGTLKMLTGTSSRHRASIWTCEAHECKPSVHSPVSSGLCLYFCFFEIKVLGNIFF